MYDKLLKAIHLTAKQKCSKVSKTNDLYYLLGKVTMAMELGSIDVTGFKMLQGTILIYLGIKKGDNYEH